MRATWFAVLVVVACSQPTRPSSPPASAPPASAPAPAVQVGVDQPALEKLADELATAARPCDAARVSDLMDRPEFLRLVQARAKDHHASLMVTEVLLSTGAQKICAILADATDLRFLHIRTNGGEPLGVLRKVSAQGFGHFDVRATPTAAGLRILDLYSHNNGTWVSEEIAEISAVPAADDPRVGATINKVNQLERADKHLEALAALDSLPEGALQSKPIQSLRVAIAGRTSVDAYKQAIDERARRFPEQKPTPLAAMNAAFMRGDFAEALRQIDVLDANVGGDPFLDTIRASIVAQRNGRGDLEAAAALAERAVRGAPQLSMPQGVKLTLAVMRGQWSLALSTIEIMERDFGIVLSDEQLRADPKISPLVTTPAYAEWRKRHP